MYDSGDLGGTDRVELRLPYVVGRVEVGVEVDAEGLYRVQTTRSTRSAETRGGWHPTPVDDENKRPFDPPLATEMRRTQPDRDVMMYLVVTGDGIRRVTVSSAGQGENKGRLERVDKQGRTIRRSRGGNR